MTTPELVRRLLTHAAIEDEKHADDLREAAKRLSTSDTFLREVLNTAAVKEEAAAHSGGSSPYHAGVMQGASLALAVNGNGTTDSLIAEARARAKRVMRSEDWRRDLALYDTLVRRFS